jgi:hypothetical protein
MNKILSTVQELDRRTSVRPYRDRETDGISKNSLLSYSGGGGGGGNFVKMKGFFFFYFKIF